MTHQHDPTAPAVLLETRNGFEAEAIAAALNNRGITARTADTAGSTVMSGVLVRPKVLVPENTLTLAKQVLAEVRAEMSDIDWESMDVGEREEAPRIQAAKRGRRVLMTASIILIPVGLAVLALGMDRQDRMLQALGGAVMLVSLTVMLSLIAVAGRRVDPDD